MAPLAGVGWRFCPELQLPYPLVVCWNLNNLGVSHVDLDDLTAAENCFRRALSLLRRTGDQQGEGICLNNLGDLHQDMKQHDVALEYYERSLTTSRQLDDQRNAARTLTNLARTHCALGNTDAAIDHWRQAHDIFTELGDAQADDIAKELAEITD